MTTHDLGKRNNLSHETTQREPSSKGVTEGGKKALII